MCHRHDTYSPPYLLHYIPSNIYQKTKLKNNNLKKGQDEKGSWKVIGGGNSVPLDCISGVCPSEPLTVFLPDFQYKTVKLMLRLYYTNEVGLNKDEHDSFLQLIRSFNPNIGLYNGKCRICSNEVSQLNILEHVLLH